MKTSRPYQSIQLKPVPSLYSSTQGFHEFLEFYGVTSDITSALKSMKLKTRDGKDQEFLVLKLIAATKPTKLAYKILMRKNSTCPQKESRKMGKALTLKWWRI